LTNSNAPSAYPAMFIVQIDQRTVVPKDHGANTTMK